jgi:hypothetical protein
LLVADIDVGVVTLDDVALVLSSELHAEIANINAQTLTAGRVARRHRVGIIYVILPPASPRNRSRTHSCDHVSPPHGDGAVTREALPGERKGPLTC